LTVVTSRPYASSMRRITFWNVARALVMELRRRLPSTRIVIALVVLLGLALALLGVLGFGAFGPRPAPDRVPCDAIVWSCEIQANCCFLRLDVKVCASDQGEAIAAANKKAIERRKPVDRTIEGTTCQATGEKDVPLRDR